MELVSQTAKGRVYKTDSAQEAVGFAAMFNGTYYWYLGQWSVIIQAGIPLEQLKFGK